MIGYGMGKEMEGAMYYFVINPTSRTGRGQEYWNRIQPILEEKKIQYKAAFSEKIGHTEKLVRKLCEKKKDRNIHIVVLGGDGTINEAVQGIVDFHKVTLSYIPTGSSNDLARDMGISRVPEEALQAILDRKHDRYMDVGLVRYEKAFLKGEEISLPDRRFMVGCGIGFDAAVCEEAIHSKIKGNLNRLGLGKLTYLGIALQQVMMAKMATGSITLDSGKAIPLKDIFLAVGMVHRYQGGGFMFCPNAKDNDGLLDVCVASDVKSKLRILRILPTVFKGNHVHFKEIASYQAKEVLIEVDKPLWVQTDGEVHAQAKRIRLTNIKEKIHFIY